MVQLDRESPEIRKVRSPYWRTKSEESLTHLGSSRWQIVKHLCVLLLVFFGVPLFCKDRVLSREIWKGERNDHGIEPTLAAPTDTEGPATPTQPCPAMGGGSGTGLPLIRERSCIISQLSRASSEKALWSSPRSKLFNGSPLLCK